MFANMFVLASLLSFASFASTEILDEGPAVVPLAAEEVAEAPVADDDGDAPPAAESAWVDIAKVGGVAVGTAVLTSAIAGAAFAVWLKWVDDGFFYASQEMINAGFLASAILTLTPFLGPAAISTATLLMAHSTLEWPRRAGLIASGVLIPIPFMAIPLVALSACYVLPDPAIFPILVLVMASPFFVPWATALGVTAAYATLRLVPPLGPRNDAKAPAPLPRSPRATTHAHASSLAMRY